MDEDLIIIEAKESGERIDALLAHTVPGLSRNAAQHLLDTGAVLRNGIPLRKNYKCSSGDRFEVILPEPAVLSSFRRTSLSISAMKTTMSLSSTNRGEWLSIRLLAMRTKRWLTLFSITAVIPSLASAAKRGPAFSTGLTRILPAS